MRSPLLVVKPLCLILEILFYPLISQAIKHINQPSYVSYNLMFGAVKMLQTPMSYVIFECPSLTTHQTRFATLGESFRRGTQKVRKPKRRWTEQPCLVDLEAFHHQKIGL
jgi:hypothetical protein